MEVLLQNHSNGNIGATNRNNNIITIICGNFCGPGIILRTLNMLFNPHNNSVRYSYYFNFTDKEMQLRNLEVYFFLLSSSIGMSGSGLANSSTIFYMWLPSLLQVSAYLVFMSQPSGRGEWKE